MKSKTVFAVAFLFSIGTNAQKVEFTEYDLDNGLHVILHQDTTKPIVAISVMYHVGSKNEDTSRTGFAHFFEHLLFEGSQNIGRGEFMKYVSGNGGSNNANTSQDRTYYYDVFPSNQLKLGLWLESERMMHPVINEIGVQTQNEVVKEEKRMRFDNQPYGNLVTKVFTNLFPHHPYHWTPIGSMDHLDAAKLSEFQDFFKKFYVPNNAVLTIAGNLDIPETKKLVEAYFGPIPKGAPVIQPNIEESPITHQIIDTTYDSNIQIPAIITAYRVPGMKSKESKVLELITTYLSTGASSKLSKKLVDEKKEAVQVASFNYSLEDYGSYIILALPMQNTSLDTLLKDIDEEIEKLKTNLISENDFQKIRNQMESSFVNANSRLLGVAENLSNGYTFYKNTNEINETLDDIKKITREEIQDVAKKYLNKNERVVIYYLPKPAGN